MELFFSYVFLYGKIGFLTLFCFADGRAACWYGFGWLCLWIFLETPQFIGKSKIIKPTQANLGRHLNLELIERNMNAKETARINNQQRDFASTDSQVLIFTAHWAEMSFYTYPMWFKFASKFTTSKVRFYQIDTQKHANLAKMLKISTKAAHLPCVVLLEDSKEYLRFPIKDEKGR